MWSFLDPKNPWACRNNLLFWDGTFYWNADEAVPPYIDDEEEDEDEDEDQDQSSDDSIDIMNWWACKFSVFGYAALN